MRRLTAVLPCSATIAAEHEGDARAMTTRQKTSAIGRAAKADPAATLILGSLLLLIRP
jgi:hypothetical protein